MPNPVVVIDNPDAPHAVVHVPLTESGFSDVAITGLYWPRAVVITAPAASAIRYVPPGQDETEFALIPAGTSHLYPLAGDGGTALLKFEAVAPAGGVLAVVSLVSRAPFAW